MTPADEIRQAAQTLRNAVNAVGGGPEWYDASLATQVLRSAGYPTTATPSEDGDYIALMNPAVGLSFADLLDASAEDHEHWEEMGQGELTDKAVLAVARAINGSGQ